MATRTPARKKAAAPGSKLATYRQKRDPKKTPEPVPRKGPLPKGKNDTFVIQEHHASALHWDFRLERDGVLVSWAIPKGLPADPKTNHLAVQTEDHPIEYAKFEGDIPKGEYGGGKVLLWDRGRYTCEKWDDREVKVVLNGQRAKGRYVLFKTKGKNWMIHRMEPPVEGWAPMPKLIKPMLATLRDKLPRDDEKWGYEFKWDGVRAVVYVEGGRPRVLTRNDRDATATYPELREMAESLGARQVILDGELVAMDEQGRPSFGALQPRMHVSSPSAIRRLMAEIPVTFLAFDVLYLDGQQLLEAPYTERREILESLKLSGPCWQTPPNFVSGGKAVFAASKEQGLEGIIAKRLDSAYHPGKRNDCWQKIKNWRTQEVVIGGWKPGEGRRQNTIGSLLLGIPDDDGVLQYVGHVGTGFTEQMLHGLQKQMTALERKTPPFGTPVPREHAKGAYWVKPQLVGEVVFGEWTRDGRMRHPAWRGLRPDKDTSEVVRES